MAIRLTFTDDDPGAIGFGLSPLSEAVLSMHVLLHPKVHAAQHPWIREMRRLPAELRRELQSFRFLLDDASPDCVLPPKLGTKVGFHAHLDAIARLDPSLLAYDLAPLSSTGRGRRWEGVEAMESAEVRDRAVARAGTFGEGCVEVARLAWTTRTRSRAAGWRCSRATGRRPGARSGNASSRFSSTRPMPAVGPPPRRGRSRSRRGNRSSTSSPRPGPWSGARRTSTRSRCLRAVR